MLVVLLEEVMQLGRIQQSQVNFQCHSCWLKSLKHKSVGIKSLPYANVTIVKILTVGTALTFVS